MQFFFQQLEQEKHRLRCELEVMEDEYEQRITELQSDLSGIYKNYFNTFLQNCNNFNPAYRNHSYSHYFVFQQ